VQSAAVMTADSSAKMADKMANTEDSIVLCGLWTLEERIARPDLIEVYKIIHGISSVSFDTFFEFNSYRTTRRHSLKLMKRER